MKIRLFICSLTAFLLLLACGKESTVKSFIPFQKPANFPAPAYHFQTNAVTEAGFELGKKLFYDTRLSQNNTISCGSCHIQTSAFTHHGHSKSHGIFDLEGTRNSPAIMNMAWSTSFMWDGGIFDLDLQAIAPITNHVEMGETMANVLQKVRDSPEYPPLFEKAFGQREVTSAAFLKSLSQFMLMCISSNSKYDSVLRNEGGVTFTEIETKGYALFKSKCSSCHKEPLFTDHSFRNNGLTPSDLHDEGRFLITQNETDRYRFKVPSLRNLSFTAPYMHDGRFLTLDAVFDHYNSQVVKSPSLDSLLVSGIQLSSKDRMLLTAFLNTLNDRKFILDKRFSEP